MPDLRPADQARLGGLAALVGRLRSTLRYVDYAQAERDCERLGTLLLDAVGRAWLSEARLVGIPRGGLLVAGMLAYVLDLGRGAFDSAGPQRPLLLVDDCALTGKRFADELARGTAPVVFAHLYSHPELRRAILECEPRVSHCLAARDLGDHARELYPEPAAYEAWRERWRRRLGPGRYWHGQPELVCFAWSEPDRLFWNPETETIEEGWRFLPPDRCLKNRSRLGLPPRASARRRWRVAEAVVSGEFDGQIWLYHATGDRLFAVADVAADMWRALAAWGEAEAAAGWLAGRYDAAPAELRHDLERFAERLAADGLLAPAAA